MWPLRRGLPTERRNALRQAKRLERRGHQRRAPLFLLAALLLAGGAGALLVLRDGSALPRFVHGLASAPPAGARLTGRVSVIDGDTLAMSAERLRLHGIDAPELWQACERAGRPYACGEEARQAMVRILAGGVATCVQRDTDRYGRRVVRCHNEAGTDIGGELVRQGWAIAFRRYSTAYVAAEAEARAARRGLWSGRFEDPADWRARSR